MLSNTGKCMDYMTGYMSACHICAKIDNIMHVQNLCFTLMLFNYTKQVNYSWNLGF